MAGKKKTSRIQEEDIPTETKKQKTADDSGDNLESGKTIEDQVTVDPQVKEVAEEGNGKSAVDDNVETKTEDSKKEVGGRLLICGGINWDLIGRKEVPKSMAKNGASAEMKNLWAPHVWSEKIAIRDIISSCCACHSVIITDEGKAMTFGRNDKGQLGHGDTNTRNTPEYVKALEGEHIVSAACGKGHTLFLTDKGVVYSCGDNKMGQLGHGNQTPQVVTPTKVGTLSILVRVVYSNYCFLLI